MKRLFLGALLLAFSLSFYAQNVLSDFVQSPLLKNANISLLVKDLKTEKTLYSFRANNTAVPASTMKLVTTATALELLGPDFCFKTTLEIDGEIVGGILEGNLIIRGSGDPTLGSAKLGDSTFMQKWVEAVKSTGITQIKGSVVANTSIFDQQIINSRWIWEDMGNYYAPGIHGISYLDNTFKLYFKTGKPGTQSEIVRSEPVMEGMTFTNYVKATGTNRDNAYFYGEPYSQTRTIFGEIPANKAEFAVKGDLPNPGMLLAQHFQAALAKAGIETKQPPKLEMFDTKPAQLIYTHQSLALKDIITETNVKSNNHYAEYLFKYLGTKSIVPSTNKASAKFIEDFWRKRGLSVSQLFEYDGSGLAPSNGVSANFFVELLTYMRKQSKYSDAFFKSLPIGGVNGTLASFLYKTPLQSKVFAKSGTLTNVKSYAGYIEGENYSYVFAIIVNNPNGNSMDVVKKMETFLIDITK